MTSFDDTSNQDPDPMVEGFRLELHVIEEDDRLKNEHRDKSERHKRPTRPDRPKMSPPVIPRLHQEHLPGIAPEYDHGQTQRHELILANAELLRVQIKPIREGVTKTCKKSNRSDRSKSPNNLRASAPPNPPRKLQSPGLAMIAWRVRWYHQDF